MCSSALTLAQVQTLVTLLTYAHCGPRRTIQPYTVLFEYEGEVITEAKANACKKQNKKGGVLMTYLFTVGGKPPKVIDATNLARSNTS